MIILVEIHVKGFLWKCAKNTSIYGQKLSGVIKQGVNPSL